MTPGSFLSTGCFECTKGFLILRDRGEKRTVEAMDGKEPWVKHAEAGWSRKSVEGRIEPLLPTTQLCELLNQSVALHTS